MTVFEVSVAAYAPTRDARGLVDAWAAPASVMVLGWGPTKAEGDQQQERNPATTTIDIYPASAAGGHRAHWTLPDGVYEQVGVTKDYSHGPWWHGPNALLVATVRKVDG